MAATIPILAPERLAALADEHRRLRTAARRRRLIEAAVFLVVLLGAARIAEVDLGRFFGNIGAFTSYVGRILVMDGGPHAGESVFLHPDEWLWGLSRWGRLLLETLLIAYAGTIMGAVGAFFANFVSARNLGRAPWLRFTVKRCLEFCRTVPDLVFALIFVVAFGLGPMPGVLALAIHTMGALGKQFGEVVENIDMKPVEGLSAAGGSWWQTVRFAVMPQVLSNFASYTLLRFEINVRGAAVMGFVGAGGIGQDLIEAIRKFYYSDVSAILALLVVTVMVIDLGTERLRHHLIGREVTP